MSSLRSFWVTDSPVSQANIEECTSSVPLPIPELLTSWDLAKYIPTIVLPMQW